MSTLYIAYITLQYIPFLYNMIKDYDNLIAMVRDFNTVLDPV